MPPLSPPLTFATTCAEASDFVRRSGLYPSKSEVRESFGERWRGISPRGEKYPFCHAIWRRIPPEGGIGQGRLVIINTPPSPRQLAEYLPPEGGVGQGQLVIINTPPSPRQLAGYLPPEGGEYTASYQ